MIQNYFCPCKSQKTYNQCCERYHEGDLAENALILMRSRYSAYANGLIDYIILTTHSSNPKISGNRMKWLEEIEAFSKEITFEDLKILHFEENDQTAFVTFTAILKRGTEDVSFTEKSAFIKVDQRWLYASGEIGN